MAIRLYFSKDLAILNTVHGLTFSIFIGNENPIDATYGYFEYSFEVCVGLPHSVFSSLGMIIQ